MSRKRDNSIDSDKVEKVYLFSGEVDARRRSEVDELVAKLVDPTSAAFDLEVMDSESKSVEDILSAVTTAPFASSRKVVVVERVDRLSREDQKRIADFLPRLASRSCLILLTAESSAPPSKSRRRGKAVGGTAETNTAERKPKKGLSPDLLAAVRANGRLIVHQKLKSAELSATAEAEIRKHGKRIEQSALAALCRQVDGNASLLQREVEKLVTYADGRDVITLKDVESLVPYSPEDRVFPLVDAIGERRPGLAIRMLNETFASSPKPEDEVPRILWLLARHFRLIYQLKFLSSEMGVRRFDSVPEHIQAVLPQEHNPLSVGDWQRGKLLEQSRFFTLPQLRSCLKQILACELATKGLSGDTSSRRLSLETLVLKLCEGG